MNRALLGALVGAFVIAGGDCRANLLAYNWAGSDAMIIDTGRSFQIYVHPRQDKLLVQPSMSQALHDVPGRWPLAYFRHAAEAFVAPLGCGISEMDVVGPKAGASWEASYVCPEGVDLRALIREQRRGLKTGAPIHGPAGAPPPGAPSLQTESVAP
jgi:hypothetical protein